VADRNAWADFEASIAPPRDAAARVRARIDRALAARSVATHDDRTQAHKAAAAILVLKSSAIAVTIAVATLAGLHVGARAIAPPAELPAAPVVAAASIEPEAPPPAMPAAVAPPPIAASPANAPAPQIVEPSAPAPRSDREPTTPRADRLAEELALVDPGRKALARGDHAAALELFDEHARRFPDGALAPERDAYSTIARCQRDTTDRAALLAAFTRAHGGSSHLDRVRDACRVSSTDSIAPPE
jgi:hypothetical protein